MIEEKLALFAQSEDGNHQDHLSLNRCVEKQEDKWEFQFLCNLTQ